jgi:hypothetical protein
METRVVAVALLNVVEDAPVSRLSHRSPGFSSFRVQNREFRVLVAGALSCVRLARRQENSPAHTA